MAVAQQGIEYREAVQELELGAWSVNAASKAVRAPIELYGRAIAVKGGVMGLQRLHQHVQVLARFFRAPRRHPAEGARLPVDASERKGEER